MTKHVHVGVVGFFFVGLSVVIWGILFRLLEHNYAGHAWAQGLAYFW